MPRVGLRAGDGGAEVGVATADLDDRWVVAYDLDYGRRVGRVTRWWGSLRAARLIGGVEEMAAKAPGC
jgi:hypothetical protein